MNRPAANQPPDYPERAVGILRKFGRTDVADYVQAKVATRNAVASVVVVGEVKRGKSSLVNALLGRRGLLPVDVDANTSVPIQVVWDAQLPEERVRLNFGDGATDVHLDQLASWTTAAGAQVVAAREAETLPSNATVTINRGVELRAVVVDTPGVGGLDREAVDLALTSAKGAGVLVLVCDASTPITVPEVEILTRAHETVGSVVVVVSKIDKNLTRWRKIVANNRDLVRRHVGRDVPVIGVSSLRALDAVDEQDVRRRQEIERTSGIAELRAVVRTRAEQADSALARMALRRGIHELRGIVEQIAVERRTAEQPSAVIAELEQRQTELRGLQAHGQEWETYLQRDLGLSRQRVLAGFDQHLDRVREEWTRYINRSGMAVLRRRPQAFTAQIEVAVNAVIQHSIAEMAGVLRQHCDMLFRDPTVWTQIAEQSVHTMVTASIFDREVGKKTDNILDPSVVTLGIMGGSSLAAVGSSVVAAAGLSFLVLPGAAIGGGWIAINLAHRALRNGKTNLITWLRETCNAARVATSREIENLITVSRTEMVVRYRAALRDETERVRAQLTEAQRAVQADEQTRRKNLERLSKNTQIVESTIAGLEAIVSSGPGGGA